MKRMYRIGEFARLTGVTVRALHYYDRMGLLKPSRFTASGHRLYAPEDLLRLQQILTLKWMGFSLQRIKTILESPTYDLRKSLTIQKAAVEAQIARLQEAAGALERALEATQQAGAHEPDTVTISAIIRNVIMTDYDDWARQYYEEEAWSGIISRRLAYAPEEMEKAQEEWEALFIAFGEHRHEPPDSPAVQRLAARANALIERFTGGDPETLAGLQRLISDAEAGKLPPQFDNYSPYAGIDEDLKRFIHQAMTIYQEKARK